MKLPRLIHRRIAVAAIFAAASGLSQAHCARPVQVPMSATGQSVVIDGSKVSGIYPELLAGISKLEKCRFVITPVPRARLEKLYESGNADMIVASTRSTRRDAFGVFVPMVRSRATVITLDDGHRTPFKTAQDVLDNKDIRLVIVRGYDYGPAYHTLVESLSRENRLVKEADPNAVARMMVTHPNDITIMVPTILYGAMQEDPRLSDQLDKLRIEPLDNLVWGESGVYLSTRAMDPAMFKHLHGVMQRTAVSGVVYKGFAAYYPHQVLKDSVKALERAP